MVDVLQSRLVSQQALTALPKMQLRYCDKLPTPPSGRRRYVRPVSLVSWDSLLATGLAKEGYHRLAGGWMGFSHVDVIQRDEGEILAMRVSVADWLDQASDPEDAQKMLQALTSPRPDFATLSMATPQIMGIVNATPDSFSDGGVNFAAEDGIKNALVMAEEGASILDVGGESTRPGAAPVGRDEEIRRISPIITALSQAGHIVSADTRHTPVMAQAALAGAPIINDVGGFRDDGAEALMGRLSQDTTGGYAIAMHMQGTPETMQQNPHYDFAPLDVYDWLEERINALCTAGVPRSHIAIDPGFGFGKTPQHNLELINWTSLFHGLGVPVLIGVSRKSSIAKLSKDEPASARLGGSLALTLPAIANGAQIIRTHDVSQTVQAVTIYQKTLAAG